MKLKLITGLILLSTALTAYGQQMTQTVRGTIKDQDTQVTLIGATIQLIGADPIIGTITDIDGSFRLEKVPVGRITLKIGYLGYEDKVLPNLLVSSAKEVVLQISLIESIEKMAELVITAKRNKAEVLNEMSVVSARSFSVEETGRYAGSFADPARMVSAFAGVTNSAEGNNDIIVRGNSPKGILWQLEGIEIPNPNHFADEGSTGGPINALNSNMLSDSDFMSGAFAPEYGNALSGVFDMKMKKGNNEKREYTATASTLGIDFTVEGPFNNDYNGSYLANYRYSSLALIDNLGILDFGGVPKYQDLSFKVNLPLGKSHSLSLFGLGGISSIASEMKWEDEEEVLSKSIFNSDMGTVGLNHNYLINSNAYFINSLSASATKLVSDEDLPDSNGVFYNAYNSNFEKSFIRASSTFHYKLNANHKFQVGGTYTHLSYNMIADAFNYERDQIETVLDDKGESYSAQLFSSWKYRISENYTFTGGLNAMYFGLNGAYSLEPRAALKVDVNSKSSFSAGFGIHSKVESLAIYLGKQPQDDGSVLTPNQNLSISKAAHFVLGYDHSFGVNTHLKTEVYYQHLFDVPIENLPGSTYSLQNESGDYSTRALVNDGSGTNYGLELTLEQYLHRGFYYLASASIYESLYTPMDGIERKSAFAGNYVLNALGGKEWNIGRTEKNRVLFMNAKVSLLGGKRYTPIDLEASQALGSQVRKEDQPYSARSEDMLILNFSIGTRRNKKNTTRELKLDIQNLTNNQTVVNEYYVSGNGRIWESTQLPIFPTISYTFSF